MFCTFSLENVLLATAACNFSTSQLQKVVRECSVLYIFTWKCASRHSGVQFLDIGTSKSAPNMQCFVHFHMKMCFSPQRRANFGHRNFKKCSEHAVFCTFSLENVLLATAACNFWFLLWPHDSAPAALTSLLFDSPDTRIIEKTQRFATSLTFGADVSSFFWLSRYCIFFLLTLLHLLTLLSSDFTSSHLLVICFSTLHIVGSLLFKLPSIIYHKGLPWDIESVQVSCLQTVNWSLKFTSWKQMAFNALKSFARDWHLWHFLPTDMMFVIHGGWPEWSHSLRMFGTFNFVFNSWCFMCFDGAPTCLWVFLIPDFPTAPNSIE